jgi:SAM-dependent methyltransferase
MNEREYAIMYGVEERHWWYVALHELIVSAVAREARGRRLTILDAGCGTGRLCQLLAPYGEISGCDLSEQALRFCRERGLTNLFRADLAEADLGEGRYDIITSIDVLYHQAIGDDQPVLEKFCRALKPGGLLILNLVALECLRSSHDIAVHTRKRYRRAALIPELVRAGFRVEQATYRLGLLFFPIFALRLVKRFVLARREAKEVPSDVSLPPRWLNRGLLALLRGENRLLSLCALPVGTSLFVVARKAD